MAALSRSSGADMDYRSEIPMRMTWPGVVLLLLLALCLGHGLWIVRDLGPYTAVLDTYRDVGFVQGFLDGDLVGDPSIEGAKRYYPPLLHAIAAFAACVTHIPPLELLVRAAPWVNLLVPATFFLMVRRLVNASAAAIATTLSVCFDGLLLPPWMAASYTPWTSVPALTQALFFCAVWLISARMERGRFVDALTIGSATGIVFLAHTVPALILAVIIAGATFLRQGMNARAVVWLATTGAVAALWALPFIAPLVLSYHLKIVHANGAFTDELFNPYRIPKRVLGALLPGLLALAWLGWRYWRTRQLGIALSQVTLAILTVWIILPALFIVRHFGCGEGATSAVCTAFQVPVHHWLFYLQSALACVFGCAVMIAGATTRAEKTAPMIPALPIAVFVLACALLVFRPIDLQMRERALDMRNRFDVELYRWVLTHTPPNALFVADVSTNGVHDTASSAILAAGRKSVALPFTFSNPYEDWETRRDRSDTYLAAARSGSDNRTLCRALTESGPGNSFYIALTPGDRYSAEALQPVFHTAQNTLYSVRPSVCN